MTQVVNFIQHDHLSYLKKQMNFEILGILVGIHLMRAGRVLDELLYDDAVVIVTI